MCAHDLFLMNVIGRLIRCDAIQSERCARGLNQRRRFGKDQTGVGTAKPKGIRYGGASVGA